ncbi:MAG TPA: PEP-CTERM sorting domain-containing protein [Tepidisphaeraceae bacterium]
MVVGDTSLTTTGASPTFISNGDLTKSFDGKAGGYGTNETSQYTANANMAGVTSTNFNWNVPGGGTFDAKTFIVSQNLGYSGFTGSESYQLAASPTVGGAFTNIAGATGTAGTTDSVINVLSSSTATTVGKLKASMSSLVSTGGNSYALMQEILAIPDQLTPITGNTAVADSTYNASYPASHSVDGRAALEWAAADGTAGHTLTITLGTPGSSVGAILFEGEAGATRTCTFDVYFDSDVSPTITGVTLTDAETAVLKLTTPRTASTMKLVFGAETGGITAIEEVMPFTVTPAPEPASLSLLGLGALALLRRRRA